MMSKHLGTGLKMVSKRQIPANQQKDPIHQERAMDLARFFETEKVKSVLRPDADPGPIPDRHALTGDLGPVSWLSPVAF